METQPLQPDFNRFLNSIHHRESHRIPLSEVLIEYPIQSQFLGRDVAPDDLSAQVAFWSTAGFDYITVPVSLMSQGKVTGKSKITRGASGACIKEKTLPKPMKRPGIWNTPVS